MLLACSKLGLCMCYLAVVLDSLAWCKAAALYKKQELGKFQVCNTAALCSVEEEYSSLAMYSLNPQVECSK